MTKLLSQTPSPINLQRPFQLFDADRVGSGDGMSVPKTWLVFVMAVGVLVVADCRDGNGVLIVGIRLSQTVQ